MSADAVLSLLQDRVYNQARARHAQNSEAVPLCLPCGQTARLQECATPSRVFCSGECQALYHHWTLGMPKRLRDEVRLYGGEHSAWPDELLCTLLLRAYDARLRTRDEYEELMALRGTSLQFRRVIDECVVPHIVALGDQLAAALSAAGELAIFSGVRELRITAEFYQTRADAEAALEALPALVSLEVDEKTESIFSPERKRLANEGDLLSDQYLGRMTQLERLTLTDLIQSIGNVSLRALTRLTRLDVLFETRDQDQIQNATLAPLTRLQTLCIAWGIYSPVSNLSTMQSLTELVFTPDSQPNAGALLRTLPRPNQLRRLAVHDPGDFRIQGIEDPTLLGVFSNLTALSIPNCDNDFNAGLSRLTALRSLILDYSREITGDTLAQLTSLEALSLRGLGNQQDMANPVVYEPSFALALTRVRWLCVDHSGIGGATLQHFSALTYLDLTEWNNSDGFGDATLARMSQLRVLKLYFTEGITGASFGSLVALRVLYLYTDCRVKARYLPLLSNSLQELYVRRRKSLDGAALRQLTQLRVLSVYAVEGGANVSARDLEPLTNLQMLAPDASLWRDLQKHGGARLRQLQERGVYLTDPDSEEPRPMREPAPEEIMPHWENLPVGY